LGRICFGKKINLQQKLILTVNRILFKFISLNQTIMPNKKKRSRKAKYSLGVVLSVGLMIMGSKAFAQGATPPPPPPNPLSLFKKKKPTTDKKDSVKPVAAVPVPPAGGPPPPPNPLNLFKKKTPAPATTPPPPPPTPPGK
jgi:hypothetical protein